MMNKFTNENIPVIADLLSPIEQPVADLDKMSLQETNVVIKWLWRITDASYELEATGIIRRRLIFWPDA